MITSEQIKAFEELKAAFSLWQRLQRDVSDLQEQVDIFAAMRDNAEKEIRVASAAWCRLMSKKEEPQP